jgi:peptidoglycan/LPS O-acetylase OafA/YrhL
MRAIFYWLKRTNILSTTTDHLGRSHGIDALRGIFACWVLMAHLVPWTQHVLGPNSVWTPVAALFDGLALTFQWSGETHPAVVGFIVLSGYCIHRNGLRSDPSELGPFAIRRCFRILPVYVAATAFGLALLYSYGNSVQGKPIDVNAGCLAAKYVFWSVFTPTYYACEQIDNGPLITVTVEIVLYFLYGAFFWLFVWQRSERWIWALCGLSWIATTISAAFANRYTLQYAWWQNGSVFGFLPYWWLGAAFVNPTVAAGMRHFLLPLIVAWATMTTVLMLTEPNALFGEIRKLVFACCVGVLICKLEILQIGRNNPVSTVGRAGYSIYAFHGPLAGTLALAGTPLWLNVCANIVFGMAAYSVIERPFIGLGKTVVAYVHGNGRQDRLLS